MVEVVDREMDRERKKEKISHSKGKSKYYKIL